MTAYTVQMFVNDRSIIGEWDRHFVHICDNDRRIAHINPAIAKQYSSAKDIKQNIFLKKLAPHRHQQKVH